MAPFETNMEQQHRQLQVLIQQIAYVVLESLQIRAPSTANFLAYGPCLTIKDL